MTALEWPAEGGLVPPAPRRADAVAAARHLLPCRRAQQQLLQWQRHRLNDYSIRPIMPEEGKGGIAAAAAG